MIGRIAAARGRSFAQVVLRWHIQHGHILIPKSMHRERMEENVSLFDFELSAQDLASIDALDKAEGGRIGPSPDAFAWIPSTGSSRPTLASLAAAAEPYVRHTGQV